MIKGIWTFNVNNADAIIIENLVLNNGLISLLSGTPWGSSFGINVGSDDLEPKVDQTDVQSLLYGFSSGLPITVTTIMGPDVSQYGVAKITFTADELTANGLWAELSLPNFNRVVLTAPGSMPLGSYTYAMSSANSLGESALSNTYSATVAVSGSSVRVQWADAPGQISSPTTASHYTIYRDSGSGYAALVTLLASGTRGYFYDRGEITPVGSHSTTWPTLNSPALVSGTIYTTPTPKAILKTNLMSIDVTLEVFIGNTNAVFADL